MTRWLGTLRLVVCASLFFAPCRAAWAQMPIAAEPPPRVPVIVERGSDLREFPLEPSVDVPPNERHRLFPRLAETQPVREQLHRHGLACFATINTVGCTSLHSELTFVFGSCRAFFGEPCFARPDGAPGQGYGAPGLGCGSRGCP
jgi:hypothetical protein